jgi:p-cumate 2,3-dioxygenase subunit beta
MSSAALNGSKSDAVSQLLLQYEVEAFLYHEAELLDEWRLEEWLDLLTEDCRYDVPAPDRPQSSDHLTFALIHDSRTLIEQRVIRLKKPTAHAEHPHSRTRRMITNVRVQEAGEGLLMVRANFDIHRYRNRTHVMYVGEYLYHLVRGPVGELRVSYRRATLDLEALNPESKVSVIL